jgi:hypothetical protein
MQSHMPGYAAAPLHLGSMPKDGVPSYKGGRFAGSMLTLGGPDARNAKQ